MAVSAIRTVIIYAYVIFAVRLMGKRQIGELQPVELVVTMMISDLAAVPMQDNTLPLLSGLIPITVLMGAEMLLSAISLKSGVFNRLLSGNPVPVICDGALDIKALKKLRIGIDDLIAMLHAQNIFDIMTVQYAVIEVGGKLTCFLRPSSQPVTCGDVGTPPPDDGMPVLLISDGYLHDKNLKLCNGDRQWLDGVLAQKGIKMQEVLLMTADRSHNLHLIGRDGGIL